MVTPGASRIPVYRPRLPSAEALRPYLETLDATRTYSNHGPLERRLAKALSRLVGFDTPVVATASSGYAALAGAILAHAGRAAAARPVCLCPSYTFVATAAAIEQCGYDVHFVDVDPKTWQLDPAVLSAHPELPRVGLVVPVGPYGRGVPQREWLQFQSDTGVPVVIDGAATLERLVDEPGRYLGAVPVALSFHATKVFATGEGGAVVTTDEPLLIRSLQAMNFGFMRARRADTAGFNGKMSEYHAAVGLAELDGWPAKRAQAAKVLRDYESCAERLGLGRCLTMAPDIGSCYVLFESESRPEAEAVTAALTDAGVEYRHWYGQGLHGEPYFADTARDPLPITEGLAPRLLGLPLALDLGASDIERVLTAVARGCGLAISSSDRR